MEHKEQGVYAVRDRKQSHYDQRLILKVVKEVEAGLPRKEANRIYELGKSCLHNWMRKYGSMNYQQNIKRKSYTNLQKKDSCSSYRARSHEYKRGANCLWCKK